MPWSRGKALGQRMCYALAAARVAPGSALNDAFHRGVIVRSGEEPRPQKHLGRYTPASAWRGKNAVYLAVAEPLISA